jgi:hypothetical protein
MRRLQVKKHILTITFYQKLRNEERGKKVESGKYGEWKVESGKWKVKRSEY